MKCENCNIEHTGQYGSGRFCGIKCSRGFATKNKRAEINKKVSAKLFGRLLSEEHKNNIKSANNFNRKEKILKYCLECNNEMLCRPSDNRKYCNSKCWVDYTEKHKEPFLLYRQRCNFRFKIEDYPEVFDLDLVEKYGWYSPSNKGNNLNGVSKDHMLSIKEGYILGINPDIISHPANCRIILHRDNQSKREKSSIKLDDLLIKIKIWDNLYNNSNN